MNIKKITSNRPLLSIDDPSIYQGENEDFLQTTTLSALPATGTSTTLYLIGENNNYIPYIWSMDGTFRRMSNPFSKGPTLPYPNANNVYQLNDNLVAIDNHLYALRKELSYWNLYKISYSVDVIEDFATILASLSPGEALIINFESILQYGGIEYKRGDVIVRLTNGEYVTIEGSTAGFYYPCKITKQTGTKTYTLEYRYKAGAEPTIEIANVGTDQTLTDPAKLERFSLEGGNAEDSVVYGVKVVVGSGSTFTHSFTKQTRESNPIPPIIKFYTSTGEEVWLDFTCQESGSQYTINISSKPNTLISYAYIK